MIPNIKHEVIVFVFMFTAATPFVSSAGESTQFFGDLTCANYVEAVDGNANHPYQNWIGGFITGVNYLRSRTTPNDFSSYRVWVKNYCQQNPFDPFFQALARLDYSLGEGTQKVEGSPAQKRNAKK